MPTTISGTAARAAAARRLSWPDTARLLFLLARMRWFDRRLTTLHRRVEREGGDIVGTAFLILARRWLATHEAIGKLLGCPLPLHVAQVQAILRIPTEPRSEIARRRPYSRRFDLPSPSKSLPRCPMPYLRLWRLLASISET